MKVIRVKPNGRCLFIALRLALESVTVLRNVRMGRETPRACFNGYEPAVIDSAESLAELIFAWYSKKPCAEVPGFGQTGGAGAPAWRRMDILATEMVSQGRDVDDNDAAKQAAADRYLERMRQPGEWGSTPEYLAFAFLSKLAVEVYQPAGPAGASSETPDDFKTAGLTLINSVKPPVVLETVHLLYNGHNHYDLLVTDALAAELSKAWPEASQYLKNV